MRTAPSEVTPPRISPLFLSDRLLTLAQNAHVAGYQDVADRLVSLAYEVFDEPRKAA